MNWIQFYNQDFESSSGKTPQFKAFTRTFRREFKRLLNELFDIEKIEIGTGHFYLYGFFQLVSNEIFYFNIGDVRWLKGTMLLRTAKHFKDWTGGSNNHLPLDTFKGFRTSLEKTVNNLKWIED